MEGPDGSRWDEVAEGRKDIPESGWGQSESPSHSGLFSLSTWGGSWGCALSCRSSSSPALLDNGWDDGSLHLSDNMPSIEHDDEAKLAQLRSAESDEKFPGLFNLGNTCFLNSVLQCLTYTLPLANYIKICSHKSSCLAKGFCAMCAMEDHIKNVFSSSGDTVSPVYLTDNLSYISKSFVLGDQQDAHECFFLLLEALQKCCERAGCIGTAGSRCFVSDIFIGELRSRVECNHCFHRSDTFEDLLSLSLEVESCNTITEALHNFIRVEALEEDVQTFCEHCKGQMKRTKQTTFEKPPQVLVVHLKRFRASSVILSKIVKKIDYELMLDITPFMSKGGSQIHVQESELRYNLYAILVHSGWSLSCGHYFCYIKTSVDTWHCMNDSLVFRVSENTVLDQEAYILFYIREDTENVCRVETEPSADLSPKSSKVCGSSSWETPETTIKGDVCSISGPFSASAGAAICDEEPKLKSITVPNQPMLLEKHAELTEASRQAQDTTSASLNGRSSMQRLSVKDQKVCKSEAAEGSLRITSAAVGKSLGLLSAEARSAPDSFHARTQQSFHRLLHRMPSSRRHALFVSATAGQDSASHNSSPASKDAHESRSFRDGKKANPLKQQHATGGDRGDQAKRSVDSGKRQERGFMVDVEDKLWIGDHSADFGGRKVQRVGGKRIMASFVD